MLEENIHRVNILLQNNCKAAGGHPIFVETSAENEWIKQLAANDGMVYTERLGLIVYKK